MVGRLKEPQWLLFFVGCQRTHFKTINRHNRNKWLKSSLVARAVNNLAEGYFLIPCFPLRQVRPHTSEFFLSLAEPLKVFSQFTEKLKPFHLFIYFISAFSFMSLTVSRSTFTAVRCSFTETLNQLWLKLSEFSPSLCLCRNEGLHGTRTTPNFKQLLQTHT